MWPFSLVSAAPTIRSTNKFLEKAEAGHVADVTEQVPFSNSRCSGCDQKISDDSYHALLHSSPTFLDFSWKFLDFFLRLFGFL